MVRFAWPLREGPVLHFVQRFSGIFVLGTRVCDSFIHARIGRRRNELLQGSKAAHDLVLAGGRFGDNVEKMTRKENAVASDAPNILLPLTILFPTFD